MHEIGVVRAMVKTVTDYAAANQIDEISEIVADCGELSLVIPEYVEELYPPVVKGTPLENTKLIVNIVPGMPSARTATRSSMSSSATGIAPTATASTKRCCPARTLPSGRSMSRKNVNPGLWRPKK